VGAEQGSEIGSEKKETPWTFGVRQIRTRMPNHQKEASTGHVTLERALRKRTKATKLVAKHRRCNGKNSSERERPRWRGDTIAPGGMIEKAFQKKKKTKHSPSTMKLRYGTDTKKTMPRNIMDKNDCRPANSKKAEGEAESQMEGKSGRIHKREYGSSRN